MKKINYYEVKNKLKKLSENKNIVTLEVFGFGTDVDIILVYNRKSYRRDISRYVQNALEREFGRDINIIFRPPTDKCYFKRDVNKINFDIIKLPEGSSYLRKRGYLVFNCAFNEMKNRKHIFGRPLEKSVDLPSKPTNINDRIDMSLRCDDSINDLTVKLDSLTSKSCIDFNISYSPRILRFIVADANWVYLGKYITKKNGPFNKIDVESNRKAFKDLYPDLYKKYRDLIRLERVSSEKENAKYLFRIIDLLEDLKDKISKMKVTL